MLICPDYQYENIDEREFEEKCEISLTHKSCHHCGEKVLFGTQTCPNCSALTMEVV